MALKSFEIIIVSFEGIKTFTALDVYAILLYMIILMMIICDDTSQLCVANACFPELQDLDNYK